MFYGSSSTMAPPSKNRLKRQSRIFSQVLYRTLSYKDRSSTSSAQAAGEDDPAELSTQISAPGVLKIFGGNICAGTNYKSVLASGSSGARELVKEALERYGLSQLSAGQYALCDVIGRFEGPEKRWQTEGRCGGCSDFGPIVLLQAGGESGKEKQLWERRELEVEGRLLLPKAAPFSAYPKSFFPVISVPKAGVAAVLLDSQETRENQSSALQRCSGLVGGCSTHCTAGRRVPLPTPPRFILHLPAWQDSLVYLLNREQHTVGQRTQASKPSISLSAPDILPLHCTIRKLRPSRHRWEEKLVLEPIAGASISVNFTEVARTVVLRHGDLLSLGLYYLLLYKDPMKAQPLPAQTLLRLRALHPVVPEGPPICGACGNLLKDSATKKRVSSPASVPGAPRRKLLLEFGPAAEDVLLRRIMTLIEPGGDDHKLTPAFLLCLCIQHSATSFQPGDFGQLLLKVAKMIQRTVWERTRELAEKQSQHQDPAALSCFTITDLLPDLQHILFWMANAIEVLYFIQQKSPTYIQNMEEELDVRGSKESLFSSTITASEEAMTVLEEVIMYTFQQCVYYISKCLYVSLPALLECNPFQNECRESWRASPPLPEELRRVVLIYQATLDLLRQYEVHPEITSQMFAYLFFFSNTLLFNQLLDKGSSLGCFHWSQGVKLRASMRMLLEWLRGAGFEQLSQQFFAKLASVANLLAMPSSQLVQMSWSSLRAEFPALSPAQLQRVLSQCQEVMDVGCITAWQPAPTPNPPPSLCLPDEVLESFDNHPPIILPSGGFKVDLEVETLDDNIYRHLLYIRHFLWSLQSKSPPSSEGPGLEPPKVALGVSTITQEDYSSLGGCPEPEGSPPLCLPTNGCPCEHSTSEPQLQEKLKQLQLGRGPVPKAGTAPPDPSCLLTPPTTPLNFDSGSPESPQGTGKGLQDPRRNGTNGTKGSTPEGCSPTPYDYPTPESSSRSSATDDFCYVFVVELERGPIGLGMGLIDGVHTSLCSPGIYIRTLIEDSPAAADGRLSIGDRILAVNGTSLIGADYQSAVDLIRSGGKKLRFLVAKSDMEIAKKI
ncbi:RADIL protein, partial [Oreotrochilus melanogaster]|nr:RADIL protein [Oreotrochilus melanogaster]